MKNLYDIENLILVFQGHAEEYEKQNHLHPTNDELLSFNLPLALLSICKEIKKINDNR